MGEGEERNEKKMVPLYHVIRMGRSRENERSSKLEEDGGGRWRLVLKREMEESE